MCSTRAVSPRKSDEILRSAKPSGARNARFAQDEIGSGTNLENMRFGAEKFGLEARSI
jgi:hypothetical protein